MSSRTCATGPRCTDEGQDVTGKTALQLVVANSGDNIDFDYADWADGKLTCGT